MFRTQTQLPLGSAYSRPICVHEYTRTREESSSDYDLIRAGYAAAGHDTHWITVALRNPPRQAVSITYELAQRPPDSTQRAPYTLKDWDTDFDDALNLDELEDFESTDLSFLDEDGPPSKRRKLDLASLRNIIFQPHILPSIEPSALKPHASREYAKTTPIPIPPHTHPLPAPQPYSRRSWVIPVRGTLPWKHTTSAVVLLDTTTLPEPPDPDKTPNEITWTAAALAALWAFLRKLRERNAIGPMGLSFHVSPYYQSSSQQSYTEVSGMGAQPQSVSDDHGAVSIASSARRLTLPLTFVDHIKVYHEAAHSMRIRSLLDAFKFEVGEDKIRMLKGARLALLDERSKGVLVS